jgi:serine/threonine protein phosphatase PrpC
MRWSSSVGSKGKKMMNQQNEFVSHTSPDEVWTCLDVDFGAVSHQGLVRESNQDSFLVIKFGRSLENLMTNLHEDLFEQNYVMSGYGMLVADGMGGMAGGDVASRLALSKLLRLDPRAPAP